MNQKNRQLNNIDGNHTLSEFFESVEQCNRDFKDNASLFVEHFYDVSQQLLDLHTCNSISLPFAIHTLNSKYSKDTNFIAKSLVLSQTLAAENHFDQESQQVINEVNLFLALTLCKTLKEADRSKESLKSLVSSYPKRFYDLSKSVFRKRPSAFRLFTQITGVNEFKNKNQLAQSLILAALNLSTLNVGLLKTKMSLAAAIDTLSTKPWLVLNKAFVRNHLNEIINNSLASASTLSKGQLVRTSVGQFAFTISHQTRLSGNNRWTVAEFDKPSEMVQHTLNNVPDTELLVLSVQPAINYLLLDKLILKLREYDVVQKYLEKVQSNQSKRYTLEIPSTLNDFSKLLITSTNKQISEYLESRPETASIIQDYASNLTRIHSPIKDLKHAAALIGLAKLYPVVCNSEILKYQQSSRFIGSSEAFNKANLLQQITIKIAQDHRCEIPEYLGTVSLIMYHSILMIPKGRLSATAGKLENKEASSNLAECFNISNIDQWLKITGKMARQWQLPVNYLSLCKDYFHYLEGKLDPNALPRVAKTNLSALLMSHWVFIQVQSGSYVPSELPRTNLFRNILGYSNNELLSVYRDVVETLKPKTDLY